MYKLEKLSEKHIKSFSENFYQDSPKEFMMSFIKDESIIPIIALDNDKVIGFVYGYLLKRINSGPMLYIHSVDIIQSYRKQGIGKLMMNRILEIGKEHNVVKSFLITNKSNIPAVRLYESVEGIANYDDDIVYEFKD